MACPTCAGSARAWRPTSPAERLHPACRDLQSCDVVVVGAGTAGALVAARIVQNTAARVLLLEAGPRYPWLALSVPLASYRLSQPWLWPYSSVPQSALDHRRIRYPMGRVLGGSSSVNAMIAAPGPAADYDAWLAAGCRGWGWADLEPYWLQAIDPQRLTAGISVNPAAFEAPFTQALIEACEADGLTRVEALTGAQAGTCGRFVLFQRQRMRYSTAHSLAIAARTGRLQLRTGVQVQRVLFDRDQAVAVECGTARSRDVIRAPSGVVLCAGVFGSPCVLMRSGVGSVGRLEAAGIAPRCDLPGVGENLQDHIGVPVVYRSRAPSPGRHTHWLAAALRYAISRTGVMASNGCEGGAFLGPVGQTPDLEIAAMFQSWHRRRAVEIAAIVMHPHSRGWVRLDPRNPWGPPLINPRFLSAPLDLFKLNEGVDRIRAIVKQPSLCTFGIGDELMPGSGDVQSHIRQYASTHFHPVGTCKMGVDAMAVVSPDLVVQGMRRLWVVDNSIVPSLPACHSAAMAMMIAERGADLISSQLGAADGSR